MTEYVHCSVKECKRTAQWSLWDHKGSFVGVFCGSHKPKLGYRDDARLIKFPPIQAANPAGVRVPATA